MPWASAVASAAATIRITRALPPPRPGARCERRPPRPGGARGAWGTSVAQGLAAFVEMVAYWLRLASKDDDIEKTHLLVPGLTSLIAINWLQVSGATELAQIDQRVGQQLHAIVPLLDTFKAEQEPFE